MITTSQDEHGLTRIPLLVEAEGLSGVASNLLDAVAALTAGRGECEDLPSDGKSGIGGVADIVCLFEWGGRRFEARYRSETVRLVREERRTETLEVRPIH